MSNLVKRTISGIIYVALIVAAIVLGWSYLLGLTAVFAVLGILELSKMTSPNNSLPIIFIDCLSAIMVVFSASLLHNEAFQFGVFFFFSILGCLILRLILTLYDFTPDAFLNLARSVFGVIYISVPLGLLNLAYALSPDFKWIVLTMFIMIWLNDTGAFCFGTAFGKNRLCERLSPKKSWEGFWGGLGCCIAFGVAAFYIFGMFSLISWLIFGALVGLFATWGDLLESLIKRSAHVKDSGHLIPGHGGILDRIDSLLLVAPITFLFAIFMLVLFR